MLERYLGLKIDVDTYRGMEEGVPTLLETLSRFGVNGTFFLSIGPDASGRAIFQFLKNPKFLKKMWRTRALSLYGVKTAFYGTLLPSPMIALSFPHLVRAIIEAGHEVQFHAWDHRRWQDELHKRPTHWVREWFVKGLAGFEKLTGKKAEAFGAPAWQVDERVMEMVSDFGFTYLSCSRAPAPFIHATCGLMEIPSNLPCIEEVGDKNFVGEITKKLEEGGIFCLPVHAEVEGGLGKELFVQVLKEARKRNYEIVPLRRLYEILLSKELPRRKYGLSLLPGRATPCAV